MCPDGNADAPVKELSPLQNAALLETMYERWKESPERLDSSWRFFFQGFDLASCPHACRSAEQAELQSRVASLIYAYRSLGHAVARLDPLGNNLDHHPDLELERFGLSEAQLGRVFDAGHLQGLKRGTLEEIIAYLRETYCGPVGVEYIHIQDRRIRRWLQSKMEPIRNRPAFPPEKKIEILEHLTRAETFEKFLHRRYTGQKRFSLEGAEALIPAFHALVELAPELGVEELVVGMAHRGRLNVLANILDKPYAEIFSEFEDNFIPESVGGNSDVKYHLGFSSDHANRNGKVLHISLTPNPSHLEAVDPVVQGRARAKQRIRDDLETRTRVVPFLIHGDAAFAGQGLVAETLNLSQLEGYRTGGTVHFIVNNQIGFTTLPREARSTPYSTDVARMVEAPIFHVNGDDPEAVVYVTELALAFRQAFGRDAVVDMICYRRHGHNEADEPAFTQPVLYRKIKDHPSVRRRYLYRLREQGVLERDRGEGRARTYEARLDGILEEVRERPARPEVHAYGGRWAGLDASYSHAPVKTGAAPESLRRVARALTSLPGGFRLNPKVARHLPDRMKAVEEGGTVDWPFAELLAFGTLLDEGIPVRLSGQDSVRGTFSQRHAEWRDMETQEAYVPLNHIREGQALFCAYNSMLAEASVLGFEYGYALTDPHMLVIWEAQFGDFSNGAQVIVDQFITASEAKWQRTCGLVMLLPHGYEGQGPDHSSAYLERYLAACAEENIQVTVPTTPAQYFHLLRRQLKRPFRRPLVVMAPKSLLRHKEARSPVEALASGRFREVLPGPVPPGRVERVVFCSGKVYYDLLQRRNAEARETTALVRVEQLYPFHEEGIRSLPPAVGEAETVVWAQEESRNRGAWTFIQPRLSALFPGRRIRYCGRRASASPATGSLHRHREEQAALVEAAFHAGEDVEV